MQFIPSKYQQDIFSHVQNSQNNLVVMATAGSGKTRSQLEALRYVDQMMSIGMIAFNKDIAAATRAKAPADVDVRTYHSLGFSSILKSEAYRGCRQDDDKAITIIVRDLLKDATKKKFMAVSASRIWTMARINLVDDFSDRSLRGLAAIYDIELYDDQPALAIEIFEMVRHLRKTWFNHTEMIDFTDMVWLPVVDDRITVRKLDVLFVDESQDTSGTQLELIMNSFNEKLIAVGDRFQAIYAWCGAGSDSMDILRKRTQADVLPLSMSYRCSKATKDFINAKFPEIPFEVAEWANEGKFIHLSQSAVEKELVPGDMVLCRVNADLVQLAFSLIRQGKKATVRGRDIGKGLVKLIERQRAYDLTDLMGRLDKWKMREAEKLLALDKMAKFQEVQDKFDTISVMSENVETVDELISVISQLFSDEQEGIVLSSGHRSKGLEAERTVILRPDLLPHPAAKSVVAREQERNLEFVMYTRSKNDVIIVE